MAMDKEILGIHEWNRFLGMVLAWREQRPLIFASDVKNPRVLVSHMANEAQEALVEREAEKYFDLAVEIVDILFLLAAYQGVHHVEVDLYDVHARVNGQGRNSNIFELIYEVAGNLDRKVLEKELMHLLTLIFSCIAHLPEPFAPLQVLTAHTLPKNNANYPAVLFADTLPSGERVTDPDQLSERYQTIANRLRVIRNNLKKLGENRSQGMHPEDWRPLEEQIVNANLPNEQITSMIEHAMQQRILLPTSQSSS